MNNYKNELKSTNGNDYTNAIMKIARRIIDGKESYIELSHNQQLAIIAVLKDRNKDMMTVNKPATIEWSDLNELADEYKIQFSKMNNQIYLTY